MKAKFLILGGVCASIAACSGAKGQKISQTEDDKLQPTVIYGNDDRLDVYQVSEQLWKTKADSTVALMQSSKLVVKGAGFEVKTTNYGTSQSLCKQEPFYEQVTAAFCSGSLIAPDIIMTAGHCIRTQSSCATTKFVFNFAYKTKGVDPKLVAADDVYSCKTLIHSEMDPNTESDYALIRLDRKVAGHAVMPIRQAGQVAKNDPLVVIGHPSGLATKIAGNAKVRDISNAAYFIANTDTYGGNSGSAVFNADTGLIEGILVRGEVDFKYENGCYVSNVCKDDDCRGEDVTRVSEILKHVDASELAPLPVDPPPVEEPVSTEVRSGLINVGIPDRNQIGISHDLPGFIHRADKLEVYIKIKHSWIGDLSVSVQAPNGEVRMIHDRSGAGKDDIEGWYQWSALKSVRTEAAGDKFKIMIKDVAQADVGQLVEWGLRQ